MAQAASAPSPACAAGQGKTASEGPRVGELTRAAVPPLLPYNLVGQLRNGCTAFLAGPCHAITVAHCVYDPVGNIWWPGLEFSAGRNGASAWEPYGTVTWRATEVPDGWRRGGGAGAAGVEQYDYAVVVLAEPLGRRLGWMQPGGCGLYGDAAAAVQVAGYPDDRENGTLWLEACTLGAAGSGGGGGSGAASSGGASPGALRYHDCHTRGGNSGSPLWLPLAEEATVRQDPVASTAAAASAPPPCALAMHVAGETVRRWDAAGRLYGSRNRGVAVDLDGEAGAWLRAAIAKHADC